VKIPGLWETMRQRQGVSSCAVSVDLHVSLVVLRASDRIFCDRSESISDAVMWTKKPLTHALHRFLIPFSDLRHSGLQGNQSKHQCLAAINMLLPTFPLLRTVYSTRYHREVERRA
jgi:hypothetical protein